MPNIGRAGGAAVLLVAALFGITTRAAPLSVDAIPVSEDYVLRAWETDDGLPNNRVSGIAQTPDGYLWVATGGGLARFDGVRFTTFLKDSTPGLESNRMASVFAARDGALWIGLERGGVARWSRGRFETVVPRAPGTAQTEWTSSIAQDADGAIWFGLIPNGEILRWRDGMVTTFSSKEGVGPGGHTYVQADASGKVWFVSKQGCGVFDGKRFQPVDPKGGDWPIIAPARDGGMWALRQGRLMRYHADGSREVIADFGGVDMAIRVLLEDHAGDLWIGTRKFGLFRFRDGSLVRVPTSHTDVTSIMEDCEDNLWVGTAGGGLNRLLPRRFFLRQTRHGLHTDSVVSLCEDEERRLWLAEADGIPVRALDSSNRMFALPDGWPPAAIEALCPDPAGGVWMGTIVGLIRWRDGVFTREALQDPLTAVLPDRRGDLWLATIKDGLVRWRNGQAERIPKEGGLFEPRALAEDGAGRLWVGTEDGLVFQRLDGQFVPVPLPGWKSGDQIRFIVPDDKDTVWIGALNGGLYRWRSGRVELLPHNAGLPVDDLRVLAIAPGGDFWFGTERGMFRVARSEIDAAIEGRKQLMRAIAYGRNDGLPGVDFVFGFKHTATRTHDGHLWFATTRGALEIIPQDFPKSAPPLPVLIEEVQVGGALMPGAGAGILTLPPSPGPLQIRYTLPELSAPEQVLFRYRLVGWGADWILADRQRTAVFTHLPPGNYRFEVAAAEAGGLWLPATASLAITVRPAWWETPLFRAGLVIAGMLASGWVVLLVMKRRFRARMRRIEREHALDRERARIARDMHDDVGASLMHIALMSELAAGEPELPSSTGDQLWGIANAARAVVRTLDEIVWMVNPRNDTLARLIGYLAESTRTFLESTSLILNLDLPAEIPSIPVPSDVRHHTFLAVREALNNVVKHARAKTVHMRVEIEGKALTVVIADDGCGFTPDAATAFSNGLLNSEQRLASVGGAYRIESTPGAGTVVTLKIPLPA